MSDNFYIWHYLKDFTVFNLKQNKFTLPSELIHYIYNYVITNEFKINMNNNYINYIIKKKLDNNKIWLTNSLRFNKFLDGKQENICSLCIDYWKNYRQVPRLRNTHETIVLNAIDLPYKSTINVTDAFHTIMNNLDDKYHYSHIKYEVDGTYYASSYFNREDISDTIDHLLVKINRIQKNK